ncbi:Hypothetical predicted protein [Podarcis lilfordi]|uniref:Uncharacterized protein n=1 Tax=Podarcis lilfordi TaxID=74358 RepID=A0AA35KRX0_9SAUR|nr:Hypothetical predicted protein [Podarcis lilfordi]
MGMYSHMWWDCPLVNEFWKQIGIEISGILGRKVGIYKLMVLISLSCTKLKTKEECKWVKWMVTAARQVIVSNWKNAEELGVNQRRKKLNHIIILQYLTVKIHRMKGFKVSEKEEDWFEKILNYLGTSEQFGAIKMLKVQ